MRTTGRSLSREFRLQQRLRGVALHSTLTLPWVRNPLAVCFSLRKASMAIAATVFANAWHALFAATALLAVSVTMQVAVKPFQLAQQHRLEVLSLSVSAISLYVPCAPSLQCSYRLT